MPTECGRNFSLELRSRSCWTCGECGADAVSLSLDVLALEMIEEVARQAQRWVLQVGVPVLQTELELPEIQFAERVALYAIATAGGAQDRAAWTESSSVPAGRLKCRSTTLEEESFMLRSQWSQLLRCRGDLRLKKSRRGLVVALSSEGEKVSWIRTSHMSLCMVICRCRIEVAICPSRHNLLGSLSSGPENPQVLNQARIFSRREGGSVQHEIL